MKRIINSLIITIAFLTLIGVTSFVRAQQANKQASDNASNTSNYELPYPGILPGHPLYSLKMLRDKIVSLLISEPWKKAEFYLLMADKRINSGKYLVDQGKEQLAKDTISKGQNYLNSGLGILENEKKNSSFKGLIEKYQKAVIKHELVLKEILQKVSEEVKPDIRNAIEKTKETQNIIKKLIK